MTFRDLFLLTLLAALWGASFLFMRIAVPEFGALALIELRVAIAALCLLPLLVAGRATAGWSPHWQPVATLGLVNSAIPFSLLAYATFQLGAGFSAIVNASSPLFAGLIAWLWLGDRIGPLRIFGIVTGFAGVVVLVSDRLGPRVDNATLAIGAALLAAFCYGYSVNYSRARLSRVSPSSIAAGSQLAAALALLPLAIWTWPDAELSLRAWAAVIVMGVACTGIAYLLYFRLIANIGPARAITVTYLVPLFAVIWGVLFIDETVTPSMLLGMVVILGGTAMATGLFDEYLPAFR